MEPGVWGFIEILWLPSEFETYSVGMNPPSSLEV